MKENTILKQRIIEEKEEQIKEILQDERLTYGAALSIIRRIEADILKDGDTFLRSVPFKNISPRKNISRR